MMERRLIQTLLRLWWLFGLAWDHATPQYYNKPENAIVYVVPMSEPGGNTTRDKATFREQGKSRSASADTDDEIEILGEV